MLSHPLIVDAAEHAFVPVAIKNNTKGDQDQKTLQAFQEKSWNNPVVRILDAGKQDLIPRLANDWTVRALADAMERALTKVKQPVPPYLALLAAEERARKRGIEKTVFGMT